MWAVLSREEEAWQYSEEQIVLPISFLPKTRMGFHRVGTPEHQLFRLFRNTNTVAVHPVAGTNNINGASVGNPETASAALHTIAG